MRFQVAVRAVPVSEPDTGLSRVLKTSAEYFAVNDDEELHAQLSGDYLRSCRGARPRVCPAEVALSFRRSPTCLSALYWNADDKRQGLCDHAVLTRPHQPTWVWDGARHTGYYSVAEPDKLFVECRKEEKSTVSEITGGGERTSFRRRQTLPPYIMLGSSTSHGRCLD